MKRALGLMLAVLFLAVAVCVGASGFLCATIDEARYLHNEAVRWVENGDVDRAAALMVEMATLWRKREPVLEMLASHDSIHEVKIGIIEAQICLECDDHDDFLRTISITGEALDHMRAVEALSFSNLY